MKNFTENTIPVQAARARLRDKMAPYLYDKMEAIKLFMDAPNYLTMIVDSHGKIVQASKSWEDYLGWPAQKMHGRQVQLFMKAGEPEVRIFKDSSISDGTERKCEVSVFKDSNGQSKEVIWLMARSNGDHIFAIAKRYNSKTKKTFV